MPYVMEPRRREILVQAVLDASGEAHECVLVRTAANSPGDLNFGISELCKAYIRSHGLNYTTLNEIVGVLECAKLEFYRRVTAPYEDEKIKQNGDIYG